MANEIIGYCRKMLCKPAEEEVERLKSMNQAKLDAIHDLMADVERLNSEIDKAKAEAVKEFAKKLKLRFALCDEIYNKEIDKLIAEMTLTKIEHKSLCETETYIKE